MTGPIAPSDIAAAKQVSIPEIVFTIFNDEIARKYVDGTAKVKQADVVKRLEDLGHGRGEIFEQGWLNVEAAYEGNGWDVEYDKPAYNESYDAYFVFSRKA